MHTNTMNISAYKQLLEAFYEGNTNLEEEKALKAFFESEGVPTDMLEDQTSFLACYNDVNLELPGGMLGRLEAMIDSKSTSIDDTAIKSRKHRLPLITAPWIWTTAAAASLLLLFTLGLTELRPLKPDVLYTDTFSDPAMAAIEADKAVQLMAEKLNVGYQKLYCANVRYNETEKTVTTQLSKLTK